LILAGLAAHQGYLALIWVIFSAFIGSLCGDLLFLFRTQTWSGDVVKISYMGKKNREISRKNRPFSNIGDFIFSISLWFAYDCTLCYWVYFTVQYSWKFRNQHVISLSEKARCPLKKSTDTGVLEGSHQPLAREKLNIK
jgi:hypothetical protein